MMGEGSKYEELALRIAETVGDRDENPEPSVRNLAERLEQEPDDFLYDLLLLMTETIEQYQP